MKRKVAKLRLSPNEEARLIREEHERRRKLRIQQVREQQRYISLQIRREVEQRRQRELEQLEKQLRDDWEQQQREKLQALQRLYQESLQLVGQGHRSAKENEPDLEAIAQREEENHVKAEERYREALKELKSQRLKEDERQNRCINARKKALQAEKERSAKVASLPLLPPNPIQSIDSKKLCVVKKSDVSAFATTHYHMPEHTVDREADTKQPNAHEGAELEVRRLQDLEREERRKREEQLEKARLRGNEALKREHLVQDRERLFVELEHMQQTDLLRRRQQVSQMPPQIFQPLLKRQETREDFQREMEFAFEDMYTGERRVKGDVVVQLVPEPLPALSTSSHDQELDVSLDEIASQGGGAATQHDAERESGSTELELSDEVQSTKPAPRRALKKLLDRIRSQKNQWTDNGSSGSAAESLTATAIQIPEQDTTINTGSLSSEEKSLLLPTELPEPADAAPAPETTEQSTAADPPLPDSLASRVREFEDGRKRRAEELDREKQQQVVLLQELEEQKAKLEQMLLEAQQEREDLKAVVTQDEPVNPPEVPVHEQDVTPVTPGIATELVPPAGKDDHSRRIKEYQQRLLEQNKIHQRSVEVARHRLEEYQRALRIRYNMNAGSLPPATGFAHLPAPPQLPTAPAAPGFFHARPLSPAEVPTRESDMLVPPSGLPGSRLLPPSSAVGCLSNDPRSRRPDVTAWLTDNIMERVTEHLPERVRPSSESPPHHLFPMCRSAYIPTPIPSDPVRAISPRITVRGPVSHGSLPPGSPCSGEEADSNMERQRRQLLEVKRRALEQKEAVALQQRRQEEERQRREQQQRGQEAEMEQMRRQKETLQALIHTEEPLVPEAAGEVVVPEDIGQTRLKLLASLLRAIEESNGGTLSHLEDPEEKEHSPQQKPSDSEFICRSDVPAGPSPVSVFPAGLHPPPRAAKPPVTRFRLCAGEMMMEQHELSAIQEVETPVDSSQVAGPEDSGIVPSQALSRDWQEDLKSSTSSERTVQAPSWSSSGQRTADRSTVSGTSSGGTWRERLLTGASPESSGSDSVLRVISPLSSDSGRGADYSGPAVTSSRPSAESAHRPLDSDSSTTISTGSYITTDPELNVDADKSPSLRHCAEPGRGGYSLHISSPSAHSSCIIDSSAASRSGLAVDSLFNDSSIQHIIDKYTRELNISLSAAGRTTDSEGSYTEQPASSVSQQTLAGVTERRGEDESSYSRWSLPSDTEEVQKRGLVSDSQPTTDPILEHFSGEDPSIAEYQDQDSFRPLIGQLADQSSCLAAEQRDSAMQLLVGLPSAHSSMICQLPGPSASVSFDQGRWDSTLSRMISRLSHQPSSHWPSGGQDFYADYLTGRVASEQATTGLDGGPEESQMRPLVVEQDESSGQHSESSDERTHVDLGVSTEAGVPSYPVFPPEPSSHGVSAPAEHPHPQTAQDQSMSMDLGPERTEDSDSFHPMLAEITHNETADPSMIFHLPEHNVPTSPEGQPASGEHAVSTSSEEFETNADESEASPERLRAEEPSSCVEALQDSFSPLIASQCRPHESVLVLFPDTRTDAEPAALLSSRLTVCDDPPNVDIMEGADADRNHVCPLLDKLLEAAGEKGILEQSEITLVSLTDTTLQDQETIVPEEEEKNEDKHREEVEEKGQQAQETEGSTSTLLRAGTPEDEKNPYPDPVKLLEFQWGPGKDLQEVHQQKRRALLQRSSRRVEEIKVKVNAKESKPAPSKAKTKSETHRPINAKSKGGPAEPHRTTKIQQKRSPLPPPASDSRPNEVKSSTSEQRKRDVSEMHQRTQRLYEQLEEVKHQKAVRNRLQAYEANRLKAKEFHKKTLQKLRAKQTP
uniref:uncharacterized protein cep295 isoform X2 n=1 Tax=Gasterosteus aculeatus aculeatus TaxID=481459 RepID=UPI001A985B6D|nr:uncharacterized protein cep295 isoform X2 [Gasterosteus aculeatus aculeatus]